MISHDSIFIVLTLRFDTYYEEGRLSIMIFMYMRGSVCNIALKITLWV